MVDAIQAFNAHLNEVSQTEPARAKYVLDDDPARFSDNYNLYTASKKKGTAKDDFPRKLDDPTKSYLNILF